MITYEQVVKWFDYNKETGEFTRKFRPRRHFNSDSDYTRWRKQVGKPVTRKSGDNYFKISIHKQDYFVHRLIWLYMHGEWPDITDHINRNRQDNRWVNLRSVNAKENSNNRSYQ